MECRDANSSAAAAAVLGWPYSQLYYASYDPLIGQVGGYPNDLTGTRRKNATRETTSTLKAWLKEHKKNPYPTKSEKIMLAIISKMTLTQVSTWFANARRRLKKENKMMWDPNNRRSDDVEVDDSDSDDQTQSKPTPTKCHQRDSIANDTSSTTELIDAMRLMYLYAFVALNLAETKS
ncbi:unnamed protein product [Notodromas monacha]|uniref:Homeobox domain-containing protein n=1 Tax=Notodromas monacha TaxID=399045 RepID=A0A7R9BWM5_9CRUS|nr:unnamed protein product [Notodromas monacha]CAG0923145.1 unnamed protein product [Notodromas monacha]